ncbi:MAG: ABC transporter ATP-binding protein [Chloroflexi bacterium]|nr:ABC transporter ATP-binding protein [Chloroflexota bacterium]
MIRVENLHKHYGVVRALDGLDMTVEEGTIYGFLGPNGAGKTTTLRILAGLARPASGRASVAGVDLAADGRALSRRLGYLPEEPAFYPWMTPREFLDYLGRLHGLSAAERAAQIRELLELVHLAEAAKRRIGGFSRGMRQRLGLAAALVHNPEALLLDEPVSALDPIGRKEMLETIENLRGQCTVLMSSHILADVERVCNAVGIIARGRMVVQARREALLERYAQPVFTAETADAASAQRWAGRLQVQPWAAAVSVEGERVRVTVNEIARARREILPSAVAAEIVLRRFEEMRPSLEDVFLQLTGKEAAQ